MCTCELVGDCQLRDSGIQGFRGFRDLGVLRFGVVGFRGLGV